MTPLDVFVTEGNVDIYLSRLYLTWDPVERDNLLRLVATEESRMGRSREHLENGERRVAQGRERLDMQREMVARLALPDRDASTAVRLLETLERTQALLEQHLQALHAMAQQAKL